MTGRLGIIDWGIGGLGVYQHIKAIAPDLAVTYVSDAGHVPYGKVPPRALATRIQAMLTWLSRRDITHVMVACNAASTVLPRIMATPVAVVGVIAPTLSALQPVPRSHVIGVVGGRRTILSGAYRRGLPRHVVAQRIAQPVSAFIERGELHSARLTSTLRTILSPLRDVDRLVLACTHYPAIAEQFQQCCPRATLIDPAAHTVAWTRRQWRLTQFASGHDTFLTTGDANSMRAAAAAAFGCRISRVHRLPLPLPLPLNDA